MNIGIVNADYIMGEVKEDKNYALEKIKDYHIACGDKIIPWSPMEDNPQKYDRIYCSKIFTFTDVSMLPIDDRWICGGTGFDVKSKLSPEIEKRRPHCNYGFLFPGLLKIQTM